MRAIIIAAFAALAMIVAHMVSTEDQVIGDPDCTVDCSGQATENGIGSSLPVAPNNNDGGDNN
jgi:hypothetical protein